MTVKRIQSKIQKQIESYIHVNLKYIQRIIIYAECFPWFDHTNLPYGKNKLAID